MAALEDILEQLESYRLYALDWDTWGAAPFAPEHVDHAVRIAQLLGDYADLMHVSPYNGRVQLELRHAGRFAELDIVADGAVYVLSGTQDPLTFHQGDDQEDTPASDEELLRLARWVHGDGDGGD